ncbi:MAG: replicative DNA helicase [Acidobacteria bacterium]|nr:MAG: replicative DNA helicase [Acidobacteriota bacterium]
MTEPLRAGRIEPDTPALPWDEHAERAVLGAVLIEPRALDTALELLTPDDFHRVSHRLIFRAMVSLASRSEAIDPVTVRAELEREGVLEKAGGAAYVASLIDGLPRTTNVGTYARIVRDRSLLRQLLGAAEDLRQRAAEARIPAAELIDQMQGRLFALADASRRGGFQAIERVAAEGIRVLEELSEKRQLVTGLSTGFRSLDYCTSGFQRGDLIILAARPSMGKTALALNFAQHAAVHEGAVVGIFSMEMPAHQLFFRMLAAEGLIDSHKLRTGNLSSEEWDKVTVCYEALARSALFIDDTPGLTPMEIRAKARKLAADRGLDLLVIDYLQLMRSERRSESRQQEVSQISRALKSIAKELNVPVIALSQLSRAPEQRKDDHRPQLSDLRESGSLEQDADVVMFIFRREVYEKPEKKAEYEGQAELIIAKQRNGPTRTIPLYFVKEHTRFYERKED